MKIASALLFVLGLGGVVAGCSASPVIDPIVVNGVHLACSLGQRVVTGVAGQIIAVICSEEGPILDWILSLFAADGGLFSAVEGDAVYVVSTSRGPQAVVYGAQLADALAAKIGGKVTAAPAPAPKAGR